MTKKRGILADHKKVGKTLVAPFNQMVGPMKDVSWVKEIFPELLWIGLIQYEHGHRHGIKLVTSFSRLAREICPEAPSKIFAAASSFSQLSAAERNQLRDTTAEHSELFDIQRSLLPLASWYPNFPLRFLFAEMPSTPSIEALEKIKYLVSSLYQRSEYDPMMIQATAISLAFDAGVLKVARGLALAQFPKIEDYPETDLSRKIGGSIRSTLNMMFGAEDRHSVDNKWSTYFWNRGLEISPCEFADAREC